MPRQVWQLLQPRQTSGLGRLETKVLAAVTQSGETHPHELQANLGRRRVINAWGGYSAATTETLERLRHRGLLRIARREKGIRIYEIARPFDTALTPEGRLRRLILVIARILAPSPEKSLCAIVARYQRWGNHRTGIEELVRTGELERQTIDGVPYVWPTLTKVRSTGARQVRFLAPFDPLVWDRRRFEHFWGWSYRFEAYTPPAKRVRGYYALPLLWGSNVIGWANVGVQNEGLRVEPGFVEKAPSESAFRSELEREVEDFRTFLNLARR